MKRNENKKNRNWIGLGQELFWDRIGAEAVKHVGRGDQMKGTVHEIAHCAIKNIKSAAKVSGEFCRLTSKKNAAVVDTITTLKGKVIAREQLKDVVSPSGVRKVLKRVNSGYYRSAKIVATEESVKKLMGKSGKKIYASGVSSKTTTRTADNHGVNVRNKALLQNNIADIGKQAKEAAILSAALGAMREAFSVHSAYKKGEINKKEYSKRVVKSAGKHAAKSAAKTASALMVKEGMKSVAKASGKTALRRFAGSNVVTTVAFGMVEQASDTIMYASGKIDKKQYKENTLQNAGSTGGALAGAALGASIGSVVPGVGTAIGAAVGGMIGSIGGGIGSKRFVK
jgi:phage tail tape-measure protein